MSISDFFKKQSTMENAVSGSKKVESADFIIEKIKQKQTFQPPIDFNSASNFAKYGSAYEYYTTAVTRVYDEYPYDGSEKEKIIFELSSSYLDKYIFDNRYPKTNGYAIFSADQWGTAASIRRGYGLPNSSNDYEYIFARGGIHTASGGIPTGQLHKLFDKSAKYDTDKNRTTTFDFVGSSGVTVEFWLKKEAFDITKTSKEVILDLWNGNASSSADYGRLTLMLTSSATAGANPFRITLQSGSTGVFEQAIGSTNITTGSLANWSHYALTLVSGASGITSKLYKNGNLDDQRTLGSVGIGGFPGLVNGYIGALQTAPSGNFFHGVTMTAAGKLSASLDDFRFWKTKRTSEEIYNNWYRHVGGGTNTDDANTLLGLYYKFNEGVVGTDATDSIVLDYSGRIANGTWVGYSSGARSTNSAFTESGLVASEPKDPIIYSAHPQVSNLLTQLQSSGSEWDIQNPSFLYKTLPQWLREEEEQTGTTNTKYLFQIISSYFDTLETQMRALKDLKNKTYPSASHKPLPFADRLISERGLVAPDIFINSEVIEKFENRDINQVMYEKELFDLKNMIYTNIYNNLEHIYKAKGTEKGIRNMLRCFGIDDEIVKLNIYTDHGTHYYNDKYSQSSAYKKFINFNSSSHFSSTVYQTSSTDNPRTYISGSGTEKLEQYSAFTAETSIIIPRKIKDSQTGFFVTPFVSSSVFGMHEALETSSDYTWVDSEVANFQVYVVRDDTQPDDAKFVLKNRDNSIILETGFFSEAYNNQKWNLAVRVKSEKYPFFGNVATSSNPSYVLEFYGVTHNYDDVRDEFTLTKTISFASGSSYLSNRKRLFAGAHVENFTGSVLQQSDIKVGGVRFYLDYLEDEVIRQHNLDIYNYGNRETVRGSNLFSTNINDMHIPSADLLALSWNFETVSTSDASGQFIVDDVSSGSVNKIYGWIDNIVRREHKAKGSSFPVSSTGVVEGNYIFNLSKELPESSVTSQNITIKQDDKLHFIEDDDTSDNFYSLEKSMYQVISKEMLNTMYSVKEMNNLVGKAVDRYRMNYKDLNLVRRLFFDRNSGSLDFDRFNEYFKWIDSSISNLTKQLFPVGSRFSKDILDVVESHIFERNKYQNQYPHLKHLDIPQGNIKAVKEKTYNWKFGHAPVSNDENENCFWQLERKERTDITDREEIRKAIVHDTTGSTITFGNENRTVYQGSAYATRALVRPYILSQKIQNTIHGGVNYDRNKNRNIIYNQVTIHGHVSGGIPQNVVTVGEGTGSGVIQKKICEDEIIPNKKEKMFFSGEVGKFSDGKYNPLPTDAGAEYLADTTHRNFPFNMVSASIEGGYHEIISAGYRSDVDFANFHSDTTDYTNEIPMQGPFTQNWVGGHQHRHVELNTYDPQRTDDYSGLPTPNRLNNEHSRKEAWIVHFGDGSSTSGSFGFVGPDYGGPYPDKIRKYAVYYRDERAKRPVNIKNIKTTASSVSPFFSLGNFTHNYEPVHSFSKTANNLHFRDNHDIRDYLTYDISQILPQTTNPITLIGVEPRISSGNVHGTEFSTMKPDNTSIQTGISTTFYGGTASAGGAFSAKGFNVVGWADRTGSNDAYFQFDRTLAGPATLFFHTQTGTAFTELSPNFYIITGSGTSSHDIYWDNIVSKLNAQLPDYTTTITSKTTASYSTGLKSIQSLPEDVGDTFHLSASIDSTSWQSAFGNTFKSGQRPEFAFSCWINLSTGSARTPADATASADYNYKGQRRTLFAFNTTGYTDGGSEVCAAQTVYELAITGARGDLTFFEFRENTTSGTDCICVLTASLANFEYNHSGSGWIHVGFSRDIEGAAEGARFYINGQLSYTEALGVHSGFSGCSEGGRIIPNQLFLLNNTGSTATNPTLSGSSKSIFRGQIDEVCFWSGSLDTKLAENLYDFGYKLNVTGCYMDSGSAKRVAWYQFDDVELIGAGREVTDSIGNLNHLTCSQGGTPARFSLTSSILNEPFATFGITADAVGLFDANLSMVSPSCHNDTFFNFSNLTGGANQTEENTPIIVTLLDVVTGISCSTCPTETIITNRFSAPGSPEASSIGYLDVYNREFSVYNALPYRNLTVRGSGSGEAHGIMSVQDHLGNRRGLLTHLRRHSGQFGHDPIEGTPTTAGAYVTTPSFRYKVQRNTRKTIQSDSLLYTGPAPTGSGRFAIPTFDKFYNNSFVVTPIPASDYQYSWITGSLNGTFGVSSGVQKVFNYMPKDGIFENKLSLATGTITIGVNPSDGERVEITDGTDRVYFIFKTSSTDPECPEENDPLAGCRITQVSIGGNRNSTATRLSNAINNSLLQISTTVSTNRIELTADFIDEKFNNEIITNTSNVIVVGMTGADVDFIPAITFPTASEIFGV